MAHFDERYRERAKLGDGSSVTLRLVRPHDKDLLRRGFERLSAQSPGGPRYAMRRLLTLAARGLLLVRHAVDKLAPGAHVEASEAQPAAADERPPR